MDQQDETRSSIGCQIVGTKELHAFHLELVIIQGRAIHLSAGRGRPAAAAPLKSTRRLCGHLPPTGLPAGLPTRRPAYLPTGRPARPLQLARLIIRALLIIYARLLPHLPFRQPSGKSSRSTGSLSPAPSALGFSQAGRLIWRALSSKSLLRGHHYLGHTHIKVREKKDDNSPGAAQLARSFRLACFTWLDCFRSLSSLPLGDILIPVAAVLSSWPPLGSSCRSSGRTRMGDW